jgi:nickel/cobalt exporter
MKSDRKFGCDAPYAERRRLICCDAVIDGGGDALLGIALGLGLGARHALEPDHLAAVSVLTAEAPGPGRGLWLGALWGLGHSAALFACGLAVALAASLIPPTLADAFELLVAAMLVVLGARAVHRATRTGLPRSEGSTPHSHGARRRRALRPLVVGGVHGLAGSGALTALVMARLPTMATRLLFIACFGAGSVVGMAAITGLAGWPLARLGRHPRAARLVFATVGAGSAALGLVWAWLPLRRLLSMGI